MPEVMLAMSASVPSSTLKDTERCSLRVLDFLEGDFVRDDVQFLTAYSQVVLGVATF